ncbi:DUF551 domain-containing protein [Enterobacter chengduensis]|uniref:DUF551 domain-containing protein n=1 Tax=Enterobacter chengduensis TaxID=2494701 RepID=UPI003D986B5D
MSTISKERLEQLASGNAWVCVQDDEATELARIALASLEAEPAGCDACGGNGSVDIDHGEMGIEHIECPKCYTAPPAPIAMKDHQIRELVNELRDIAVEYHGTQQLREHIARTIRTALLHGGTLIDEDTTKQTWINCSDRMPEAYESVIFWVVDNIPNDVLEGAYNGYWDGDNWRQCTALTDYGVIDCDLGFIYRCIEPGNKKDPSILRHGSVVSHWMPLPAAPQQEVR